MKLLFIRAQVESFKYLGAVVTSLNDIENEIKSKTAVGNKRYYALGPIIKRRSISQSIKIRLYKVIIRPAVTYGAQTWTLTSNKIFSCITLTVEHNYRVSHYLPNPAVL